MTVSSGYGGVSYFHCIKNNSIHNNDDILYVKTNDVINLKVSNYILRSHDFTFTIRDKTFQEVVGHNKRISGNDEVCYLN